MEERMKSLRRIADMREAIRRRKVRRELLTLLDMTPFQRAIAFEREAARERLCGRHLVSMEVPCR